MKIKLLAIAPYPGLAKLIKEVAADFPEFDVTTLSADMEESLSFLQNQTKNSFDVIISRGGTARLLEKHTNIPVIEIQVSGYDILRTLTLLKGYKANIQMIGFSNIIQSFEAVSNIIDMDILYTVVSEASDVPEALKAAQQKGTQVIVGDTITVRLAKSLGLQGVLITSGREAVTEALHMILKTHRHIQAAKEKTAMLKSLFNELQDALVILNKSGHIIEANHTFYTLFDLKKTEKHAVSLFDKYPFFRRFLSQKPLVQDCKIEVNLFNQKYVVTSGLLQTGSSKDHLVFVQLSRKEQTAKGFYIRYPEKNDQSFPQQMALGSAFTPLIHQAQNIINDQEPLFIYGEKGSGKKLLINHLHGLNKQENSDLLEIHIDHASKTTFDLLLSKIKEEHASTYLHITGFDRLSLIQQKKFYSELKHIQSQLIFSFPKNAWNVQEKFDEDFYKLMLTNAVYVPSLKERLDEFDQFVPSFIFQFNELYGKQIVGVEPAVMKYLKDQPWKENFFELRDILQKLVMAASGEYIESSCLEALKTSHDVRPLASKQRQIDLTQTLDDIEKQVILFVLQEENMNQSKAAKRLNINRSTLWRKLKGELEKQELKH